MWPAAPKHPTCGLPTPQPKAQPCNQTPLQALKELCDKCRFAQPQYAEQAAAGGGVAVAVTVEQVRCACCAGRASLTLSEGAAGPSPAC